MSKDLAARVRTGAQLCSMRHQVAVDLALFAGARRSEIAGLSWSDVDLQTGQVRIFGKGSREAVLPLHASLISLLTTWRLRNATGSQWVFPSRGGDGYRGIGHLSPWSIGRLIHEAGAAAGVDVTPHVLRHTFATELHDGGSDIRVVQELMRHRSLTSTQIYTKVSVVRLEEHVGRLTF